VSVWSSLRTRSGSCRFPFRHRAPGRISFPVLVFLLVRSSVSWCRKILVCRSACFSSVLGAWIRVRQPSACSSFHFASSSIFSLLAFVAAGLAWDASSVFILPQNLLDSCLPVISSPAFRLSQHDWLCSPSNFRIFLQRAVFLGRSTAHESSLCLSRFVGREFYFGCVRAVQSPLFWFSWLSSRSVSIFVLDFIGAPWLFDPVLNSISHGQGLLSWSRCFPHRPRFDFAAQAYDLWFWEIVVWESRYERVGIIFDPSD
jgi:hypothetical protein